jgi:outer membrane protein assembly factor BamA
VHGNSPQAGAAAGQNEDISYDMPVLDGSPWHLNISGGHGHAPITTPTLYDEYTNNAQVLFTRHLGTERPFSQGWSAGGGLLWQNQSTSGAEAPPSEGHATAIVGVTSYNDIHDLIYSDVGTQFSLRGELAIKDWASDYGYELITAKWRHDYAIGSTPYQSLNFIVDGGARFDGPPGVDDAYALGGRSSLHGYSSGFIQGNSYYHLGIEYLHPVYWDWLRLLLVADAGNAFADAGKPQLNRVRTSIGIGLRARVNWLVNFQIEAGVAMPLDRYDSPRFFGGKISE